MLNFVVYLSLLTIVFHFGGALSAPAIIEAQWSHRQIAHVNVNPDIPEGSLFLTFSADQPISPLNPLDGLEQVDSSSWRLNLTWDNLEPITQSFINADDDTTEVSVSYSPLAPLDPLIHEMPAVNVVTDPANLWDSEIGIHVFGLNDNCNQEGEDWERPAVFQYYENSLSPALSEQIGLRINGGWSRNVDQKPLRFYFDDYGESDSIDYDFFGNSPISFKSLITRTGRWPGKSFNSVFAEEMFIDLGHLASRNRDIAIYLNNEYFGFVTFRERIDEDFLRYTHNIGNDGLNMIKDGSVKEGSGSGWWGFLDSCSDEQEFNSHQWFVETSTQLDLSSYMDWLLINILGATGDNGGTPNVTIFQDGTQPWKFLMYDEDEIFHGGNLEADLFRFLSIASVEEFDQYKPEMFFSGNASDRIRWAGPFRGLMQNSEFKIAFKNRFESLMANEFSESALQSRLEAIRTSQGPEMQRHHERWGQWGGFYNQYVNQVSSWLNQRLPIINNQFDEFLESYRVPVELSAFSGVDINDGSVQLNWQTESEETCVGFVLYRGLSADNMTEIASYETDPALVSSGGVWNMAAYEFVDDEANLESSLFYQLAWVANDGSEELLPWLLNVDHVFPLPSLVINEFLAMNSDGIEDETGTPEDWVEIYNSGTNPIDLEGYYLTDNISHTSKWEFPQVSLGPGDFLLVWCDNDSDDGPLHTNFKLNGSGDTIALFTSQTENNQLIDSKEFGAQTEDVSEGRSEDGGATWVPFVSPTPGYSNLTTSAIPGVFQPGFVLKPNHPNPFNPSTTINFFLEKTGFVEIDIYNINGQKIRTLLGHEVLPSGDHQVEWNGKDDNGRPIASGAYFVQARSNNEFRTQKICLIK